MNVKNSAAGKIFYGLHMYPGLAQYAESESDPKRIYLNEDTLRKMDPTFAGKPVFVEHVDEVDSNIDKVRKEADGWVVESFFNSMDGKHWVKFIVVTERAERAIKNGFRLSNAYLPVLNGKPGQWNAVPYQDEVINGEYEHLAIVRQPRYEESVIYTPEQFKEHNENLQIELKRISNSKPKESMLMKMKFWNKKAVENSTDFESLSVTLPKSGKEYSILQLVNSMDEMEEKKKENEADKAGMVKLHDGSVCNVGELVDKYKSLHEEHAKLKDSKKNEEMAEEDVSLSETPVDVEGDLHNAEESEEEKKKAAEQKEKEAAEKKENSMKRKENFDSLKNAPNKAKFAEEVVYDTIINQVNRGKNRYGSSNS